MWSAKKITNTRLCHADSNLLEFLSGNCVTENKKGQESGDSEHESQSHNYNPILTRPHLLSFMQSGGSTGSSKLRR